MAVQTEQADVRSSATLPRVEVLGVAISAITMRDATTAIDRWIAEGQRHYVCVTGVHGVMECQRDPELRRIHNSAGMVTPDGMPMVWLGKRRGYPEMERVYGPDLMLAVCAASQEAGWRHYLYGGTEDVLALLEQRLLQRFPALKIVGAYAPPFRPLTAEEDADVVARINASSADIVWIGLGTPKQERWMANHVGRLTAAALIGVGAAFDFHAGVKRQAPRWMQRSGLEWAFRLATEPRRLWRRYLVNNTRFIAMLVTERRRKKA